MKFYNITKGQLIVLWILASIAFMFSPPVGVFVILGVIFYSIGWRKHNSETSLRPKKKTLIVICSVVAVIIVLSLVALYFPVWHSGSDCNKKGDLFSEEFRQKSIAGGGYIDSFMAPQFHINQEMNACLSENGYTFPDHGGEGTYMQITNVDTGTIVLSSSRNIYGSDVDASKGIVSYSDFVLQAKDLMSK